MWALHLYSRGTAARVVTSCELRGFGRGDEEPICPTLSCNRGVVFALVRAPRGSCLGGGPSASLRFADGSLVIGSAAP